MSTKKLKIVSDDYPENPREDFDNIGTMLCWHRRYRLGDEQPNCTPEEYEFPEPPENITRLNLFLYDHGGITMSTSKFSSHWDSGWVGWIYVTHDKIREHFNAQLSEGVSVEDKAREVLEADVLFYDHYLRGNVWGYQVVELCSECGHEKEVVSSCYGFYGDSLEYTGLGDMLSTEASGFTEAEIKAAWDKRFDS